MVSNKKLPKANPSNQNLLAAMNPLFENLHTEIKSSADTLRAEAKSNVDTLRAKIKLSADTLRAEAKSNVDTLRAEAKANSDALRLEIKSNTATLRSEIKSSADTLRSEINSDMAKQFQQTRINLISDIAPMFEEIHIRFRGVTIDIHEMKQDIQTAMRIPEATLDHEEKIKNHDGRITVVERDLRVVKTTLKDINKN